MNRKWIAGAAFVAALAVPAIGRAHEGHAHKVMGTVTARQDNRLEVRTKNGKTVAIVLNDKTTYAHGKNKVGDRMLKIGDRVVVEVEGKAPLTARSVKMAAAPVAGK